MEIEGTIYTFKSTANYELKNDIIINIGDLSSAITTTESSITNLDKNGCEVYYYYNGSYYVFTTDETADYTDSYGNKFNFK